MNHAISNLQIHIHKVEGAITTFIQNDADEVKKYSTASNRPTFLTGIGL
jgi:hypothetical protein